MDEEQARESALRLVGEIRRACLGDAVLCEDALWRFSRAITFVAMVEGDPIFKTMKAVFSDALREEWAR